MESRLASILRAETGVSPSDALHELFREVVASKSANQIKDVAQHLLSDDMLTQISRAAFVSLVTQVSCLASSEEETDRELFYEVATLLVGILKQQQSTTHDEADYALREALFDYCVSVEDYSEAAKYLSGVNLESSTRILSDRDKADLFIKCAEAALEGDEAVDAEVYMNKASALVSNIEDDVAVQLRFRVTNARVLDANRKFAEASQRYYELSTTMCLNVLQDDLLELLAKAVTCAVLGKSGQTRTRVLAMLHKDPRVSSLNQIPKYSSHPDVLDKVYNEQMLKTGELSVFQSSLASHQNATTGEGYTLLEKAIMEHNMMAISKIFSNIELSELAKILSLGHAQTEKVILLSESLPPHAISMSSIFILTCTTPIVVKLVASMITDKRLGAIIDQAGLLQPRSALVATTYETPLRVYTCIEGYVIFHDAAPGSESGVGVKDLAFSSSFNSLDSWSNNIKDLCAGISSFSDRAQHQYPALLLRNNH